MFVTRKRSLRTTGDNICPLTRAEWLGSGTKVTNQSWLLELSWSQKRALSFALDLDPRTIPTNHSDYIVKNVIECKVKKQTNENSVCMYLCICEQYQGNAVVVASRNIANGDMSVH